MTRRSELFALKGRANFAAVSATREMIGAPHVETPPKPTRTPAEIQRWLLGVRHDPYWREALALNQPRLAEASGLHRPNLAYIALDPKDRRLGNQWVAVLDNLIDAIEEGRVAFSDGPVKVRWLHPPSPLPAPQAAMIELDDWNWWAVCRSCGKRRYRVIATPVKRLAACALCVDPFAVGAVPDTMPLPIPRCGALDGSGG